MSDYETRLAADRAARAKKAAEQLERFEVVLQAGADASLWRVLPQGYDVTEYPHMATHREVETDDGTFSLRTDADRIVCSVASISSAPRDRGIRVHPGDHVGYASIGTQLDNPSATADMTRDPLIVARSLHKRVMVPGGPWARRLREVLAGYVANRAALVQHVETLRATMGGRVSGGGAGDVLDEGRHYEASMWVNDLGSIRVTCRGKVYVEHVAVGVGDLQTLAAMVRAAA